MTTQAEIKLKLFIRDLMTLPEEQILSGRDNFIQGDYETNYIVVDDLAPSQRVTSNTSFDGDSEVLSIANNYMTAYTIDFYGDDACVNADNFALLIRSQAAYELKKDLGIGIYQVSSIQDLKKLTGQQYGNRYQVSLKVEDIRDIDVDTLRIDEAQIETTTS